MISYQWGQARIVPNLRITVVIAYYPVCIVIIVVFTDYPNSSPPPISSWPAPEPS